MKQVLIRAAVVTLGLIAGIVVIRVNSQTEYVQAEAINAPPENLKVAFTADQGTGSGARAVLELIKNEGAHAVLVSGDLGYSESDPATPQRWDDLMTSVLGADFPVFASIGNHEAGNWSQYQVLDLLPNNIHQT